MSLMEPGCKLEDFGRLAQPAATNRLRCRVNVVSERYLREHNVCVSASLRLACAWITSVCFRIKFYLEEILSSCRFGAFKGATRWLWKATAFRNALQFSACYDVGSAIVSTRNAWLHVETAAKCM